MSALPRSHLLDRCLLAIICIGLATIQSVAADGPYEEPPTLRAAQVLPAELLTGPHHSIAPEVPTDGFLAYFTIHSDYGVYKAASLEEAEARVHEVYAIAALDDMKRYQVAGEAVVEGVKEPFLAVKSLVTRPSETAENIGAGLGRWVERGKLTLRKTARRAAKRSKEIAEDAIESYDARQQKRRAEQRAEQEVRDRASAEGRDPDAALAEYRQSREAEKSLSLATEADAQRNQEQIQWAKEKLQKASYRYIGYDRARRGLAQKLGVDPYSTNLVLQERLDAMAWALWAGRIGTSFALPSNELLGSAKDVNKLVWESHPKDLEVMNRKRLKALGVKRADVDAFFENPFYSPLDHTVMAADLKALGEIANRGHFFHLAQAADDGLLAVFYRRSSRILARAHGRWPLKRIIAPSETIVVALTRSGDLLLILAVDHLAWTQSLDLLANTVDHGRREAGFEGKVMLLLSGDLTTTARRELEARGWNIETWGLERPAVGEGK